MKLKRKVKSLSDVPEKYRSLYVKDGDEFVLGDEIDLPEEKGDSAELASLKAKLEEFRTNNRSMHDQLEKLKDIDPDKHKQMLELMKTFEASEDAALIKAGKLDEVLNRRVQGIKADFDKQVKAKDAKLSELTEKFNQTQSKLGNLIIEQTSMGAIAKKGRLRKGAEQDVALRASRVWKMGENGELYAVDEKGEKRFGKKGDPLTPDEWAESLLSDAPHLFEGATGGGAKGSGESRGTDGKRMVANTPENLGKYAEEIAKGEVGVTPIG